MIERSSLSREFHNDGAATANARAQMSEISGHDARYPSVALDFTDGIARSEVLVP